MRARDFPMIVGFRGWLAECCRPVSVSCEKIVGKSCILQFSKGVGPNDDYLESASPRRHDVSWRPGRKNAECSESVELVSLLVAGGCAINYKRDAGKGMILKPEKRRLLRGGAL